jgi:hypothetical protein
MVPLTEEQIDEMRRIRILRFLIDLTYQRLCVESMSLADAREAVGELRTAAGQIFPGKQSVFDLVIAPRMERVIRERFGECRDTIWH